MNNSDRVVGNWWIAFLLGTTAVGSSCSAPPQECTYGAVSKRTISLKRGERLAGATGSALVLTHSPRLAATEARFGVAQGQLKGPIALEGSRSFGPAGLVRRFGVESLLIDDNGVTIERYPDGLSCVPMTLGPELTVCIGVRALYRLRKGSLELLYENDGYFLEPQFDGRTFCVAIFTFDRMDFRTFLPKKTLTKCGAVTGDSITFERDWSPETQVLLSGGRTFLATSHDGGIVVSAADGSIAPKQLEADTTLQANLCRIWATNGDSLDWLDPRSLDVMHLGDAQDKDERAWSTNFIGLQSQAAGAAGITSDELKFLEID